MNIREKLLQKTITADYGATFSIAGIPNSLLTDPETDIYNTTQTQPDASPSTQVASEEEVKATPAKQTLEPAAQHQPLKRSFARFFTNNDLPQSSTPLKADKKSKNRKHCRATKKAVKTPPVIASKAKQSRRRG